MVSNGIYTWNPTDLYFWRDPTPQNKAYTPTKIRGPICRANGFTHIPKEIKNDKCLARS